MTELRGEPADVSSDAIVPLQVDAASGPEQVISEKASGDRRSLVARERLARPPRCVRCFGFPWL